MDKKRAKAKTMKGFVVRGLHQQTHDGAELQYSSQGSPASRTAEEKAGVGNFQV